MGNSSGVNNFIGLILFSEVGVYPPLYMKIKKNSYIMFHHPEIVIGRWSDFTVLAARPVPVK